MLQFLKTFDTVLFVFFNQTLANPVFDRVMPVITDWHYTRVGWVIIALLYGGLFLRGGKRGVAVGLLFVPLFFLGDYFNSFCFKPLVLRPRPCHMDLGRAAVEQVHLLVRCGTGFSFPSTHAFNAFALAAFWTFFYRRQWWIFFLYAALIAFSRVVVGVHYPLDVLGGAFFGSAFSAAYIVLISWPGKKIPRLHIPEQ